MHQTYPVLLDQDRWTTPISSTFKNHLRGGSDACTKSLYFAGDVGYLTVPQRSRETLVVLFRSRDNPQRSGVIAMLGGAEEQRHESGDSSAEDDKFDEDSGSETSQSSTSEQASRGVSDSATPQSSTRVSDSATCQSSTSEQ